LLSDLVAFLLKNIFCYRKSVVYQNIKKTNLNLSTQQISTLVSEFYTHFSDVFFEMIKLDRMNKKQIAEKFVLKNQNLINDYYKDNKSVILMASHYGGFEWCSTLDYFFKHKVVAVYTPLKDKLLNEIVYKSRSKHGIKFVPRTNSVNEIIKLEKSNNKFIYGLAADQSPQIRTINYWTNFLGVETLFFTGSERLAKELNIPVVFGEMKKICRGKYQMEFKLISDNPLKSKDKEITEIYKNMVENQIKINPSYYFWTHKRFKHEKSDLT
tara:strand:+ start:512 stop:1318 length:807 start_codon:yes stop_codon:yes gene_type:complete